MSIYILNLSSDDREEGAVNREDLLVVTHHILGAHVRDLMSRATIRVSSARRSAC